MCSKLTSGVVWLASDAFWLRFAKSGRGTPATGFALFDDMVACGDCEAVRSGAVDGAAGGADGVWLAVVVELDGSWGG